MFVHSPDPFAPRGGQETPASVALHRRRWLKMAGVAGAGLVAGGGFAAWKYLHPDPNDVLQSGRVAGGRLVPSTDDDATHESTEPKRDSSSHVERDGRFKYGRAETERVSAAQYTNFYEFSRFKSSWRLVGPFQPLPWTVHVVGLCRNPMQLSFDDLLRRYTDRMRERQYRHRCVERWAMAIPWYGFPLAELVRDADPLAEATHVRFVSFRRPDEAPMQKSTLDEFPWPYVEGLTLAEATNELAYLATGMYGEPLFKQHGAPIRLIVPWKYGYKSIKSIERIEFVNREPATFWTSMRPEAFPFESNVDPLVHVPWRQSTERMLGTQEEFPTQKYNGYGKWVAGLYES